MSDPLSEPLIDHATITGLAGSTVEVLDEADQAVLTLELGEASALHASGPWSSFSVTLTGPEDVRLEQGTFRLRFPDGRETAWFLVPESETTYDVSFSVESDA